MTLAIALLSTHPSIDSTVDRILAGAPDIAVSRRAASWSQLSEGGIPADVVLLDFETDDAIQIIRDIRSQGVRVVTISSIDDPKAVIRAMAAGADASIRTTDRTRDVLVQIRLAASRAVLISGRI
jgi:DNA-binding NarL/FixJ family response regulator